MEAIAKLADEIKRADGVLIGAGSGLSSSSGYNHYKWTDAFLKYLSPWRDKYGFKSPMDGFYYCFPDYNTQWAYYAAYIKAIWDLPTGDSYTLLKEILKDKDVFFLTSNIDMQADRVFSSVRHFQGDVRYFQCKQHCLDHLTESKEIVDNIYKNIDRNLSIPDDLVPRCQNCNWTLVPWVRDDTFYEGEQWEKEERKHREFLRKYLIENPEKRLLLLELGVGEMTPTIIKIPFWNIAMKNENVFYAEINEEDRHAPVNLKDRSIYIKGDIIEVLKGIKNECL